MGIERIDYSTGVFVGLIFVFGRVVTEIMLIKILSGVDVYVIVFGGFGGVEGSMIMVVVGEEG